MIELRRLSRPTAAVLAMALACLGVVLAGAGPARAMGGAVSTLDLTDPGWNHTTHRVLVYRPPVADSVALPVIYTLHGVPGGAPDAFWALANDMDARVAAGRPAAVVVAPDGNSPLRGDTEFGDAWDGSDRIDTFISDVVVHAVEGSRLRDRSARAVVGFSMGGYGAANLAARHPDVFGQLVSLAGYFHIDDPDHAFGSDPGLLSANRPYDHVPALRGTRVLLADAAGDVDPVITGELDRFARLLSDDGHPAALSVTDGLHDWTWANAQWPMALDFLDQGWPRVVGAIAAHYGELGGPAGPLGAPVTRELATPDGAGRYNHFTGGSIYWTPWSGAHEVHGGIRSLWAAIGWERGPLGYPVSDEHDVPGGRVSDFSGGRVFWSAGTGAHEVHGAIAGEFRALGGLSALGLPVTDERATPDERGRYSHFLGGSIYWTAVTGAHEVHGAIRSSWAATGYERGPLGFPVSDEHDVPGGRASDFAGGSVCWSPSTGAHAVYGAIGAVYRSVGGPASDLGLPSSEEYDAPGGRRTDFHGGSLTWTAATGVVSRG
ncbi:MAG: alpha/beta hydrolase-fold protein [Actinomycetota bacterium]|nr:alpha/beta hydrolase-fold protein [Actinomycetota bacterium]